MSVFDQISPLILFMPLTTILGTVVGSFATQWYQRRNTSGSIKTSSATEVWQRTQTLEANLMTLLNTANQRIEKLERDYATTLEQYYAIKKQKEEADIKILRMSQEIESLKTELEEIKNGRS